MSDKLDYIHLTERQLKLKKFLRHKVAVFSSLLLFILYLMVIFADFFAPYGMLTNHKYYLYAPPQISKIRFVDNDGNFRLRPFIYRQVAKRDPKTLRFIYVDDTNKKDFIYLFIEGEKYKMLGLIESNIHLLLFKIS